MFAKDATAGVLGREEQQKNINAYAGLITQVRRATKL